MRNIPDSGQAFEKCVILRAGPWRTRRLIFPFTEKDEAPLLGSFIAATPPLYYQENRREIIRRIKAGVLDFQHYSPRIPEKISAWNVYILSKVSHLLRVTPYDPILAAQIDEIRKEFVMTTPLIAAAKYEITIDKGGLGLRSTRTFWSKMNFYWILNVFTSNYFWARVMIRGLQMQTGFSSLERELHFNGSYTVRRLFRGSPHAAEFEWGAKRIVDQISEFYGIDGFVSRQLTDAPVEIMAKYSIISYRCAITLHANPQLIENWVERNLIGRIVRVARLSSLIDRQVKGPPCPLWQRILCMSKEHFAFILKPKESNMDTVYKPMIKHGARRSDVTAILHESCQDIYPLCHWFIVASAQPGRARCARRKAPSKP